ncbi:N-acetyltransferase [Rhizobium sp. ARZ01]|uniref:GNAT family N-acetyltransferase n=1 Tax=Rhizobium sp. ARZ01 TaxID=2769313 RepID=UPI001782A439|nr:N-acetyltransferase [Rhizobium sp. ARZ01]
MIIRDETAADIEAIRTLTADAFADMPYSDGSEPAIIDRLRAANALTLSLVAEDGGTVIGHVAFSPVTISVEDAGWYGLGPISVLPPLQRGGIGSALVNEGLSRLRRLDAKGCVLAGNPDYYSRFGFAIDPGFTCPGIPQEYFMRLAFSPVYAGGTVTYHPAFYG